jgi:hypothetical protein
MATQVTAATAAGSSCGALTFGGLPFCKAAAMSDPAALIRLCFKPECVSMTAAFGRIVSQDRATHKCRAAPFVLASKNPSPLIANCAGHHRGAASNRDKARF